MRLESIRMLIPEFTLVLRKVPVNSIREISAGMFSQRGLQTVMRVFYHAVGDGGILRSAGCPGQKHQLLDRMAGRQVLRIESILERKVGNVHRWIIVNS